ncbi:Hypothetical_protein [Hexamita inflata]|uniref:Hypothetical_protein n=1 Tax=Hexamita inflata TaxID=28002 RepID=A0AA86P6Z5_9EUKA|nr:Hypothetical protein HINF_LOCUS20473 [Hexamita inflata]
MLQNNILKCVQNNFTAKSERTTLIPFMFDSEVPLHTTLLSRKIWLYQRSGENYKLNFKRCSNQLQLQQYSDSDVVVLCYSFAVVLLFWRAYLLSQWELITPNNT